MAYVPGFKYDVFISYAHPSNQVARGHVNGWVTELRDELKRRLSSEMAPSPMVYMDDSSLRKAGAYPEDLESAISSSALLLTINCEPYFSSEWCTFELELFRRRFGLDPRTSDSGRRIVEVYKSLFSDGRVPKIQTDSEGIWFCSGRRPQDDEEAGTPEYTFELGDKEYERAVQTLVHAVRRLLALMRRAAPIIALNRPLRFVGPDPFARLYSGIRDELQKNYQVLTPTPAGFLDADLANSRLSVHFLSERYDEATIRVINTARQANRRLFVIIPATLGPVNPMSEYVRRLENDVNTPATEGGAPVRVFRWNPAKQQVKDVVSEIRLLAPPDPPSPKEFLVYLICDPKDLQETEVEKLLGILKKIKHFEEVKRLRFSSEQITQLFTGFRNFKNASSVRALRFTEEEMRGLLGSFVSATSTPVTDDEARNVLKLFEILQSISEDLQDEMVDGTQPVLTENELKGLLEILDQIGRLRLKFESLRSEQGKNDGLEQYLHNLAVCDGTLLLWGRAQEDWFRKYCSDLENAHGFREGRPLSSKAVLIRPRDNKKTEFAKNLIPRAEDLWEGIDLSKLSTFLLNLLYLRQSYAGT